LKENERKKERKTNKHRLVFFSMKRKTQGTSHIHIDCQSWFERRTKIIACPTNSCWNRETKNQNKKKKIT